MTDPFMQNKMAKVEEKKIQLVIAHIGDQDFGAPIDQVREVIKYKHITTVPNSPAFIAGMTSHHGEMALVIDLGLYFSIRKKPATQAKHIIIVRQGKDLFGLLIDEVSSILRIPETDIKPTPELLHEINSNHISGVYADNDARLIMILNLHAMLNEKELLLLSDSKTALSQE